MFRLEISTDNQAFVDSGRHEIAAILEALAWNIRVRYLDDFGQDSTAILKDANGATVGAWSYTPDDEGGDPS